MPENAIKIIGLNNCELYDDVGIFVATSDQYRVEILKALKEKAVDENGIYLYSHGKR